MNEGHPDKLCDQVRVQMTALSRLHSCMLQSPMQLATKSKRSTEHVVDVKWHGERHALPPLACSLLHLSPTRPEFIDAGRRLLVIGDDFERGLEAAFCTTIAGVRCHSGCVLGAGSLLKGDLYVA